MNLILPSLSDDENRDFPLANRLRKNTRHLRKWAKRTHTDCFRIYEKDIREYPLAIDFYAGRFCIYYFSKKQDDEDPPQQLVEDTEKAIHQVFGSLPEKIYWKTRSRSKKTRQYEKLDSTKEFFIVHENGTKMLVNLSDYLDTGLFLDHRETRQLVASLSKGKSLLNLFSYTCAFSVQAAAAGAFFTKSVDMSNTYTSWGEKNFHLNNLSRENNPIIRADCLKFLDDEIKTGFKYDLIILDPPTISRSKKMDQLFDIQVDYILLIKKSLKLLEKEGTVFFSTNSRKFKFDTTLFPHCSIQEITHKTLPIDFKKTNIHCCWKITSL